MVSIAMISIRLWWKGSKGACHFFNKFNMNYPSNMFVAEYCTRPPLARIFTKIFSWLRYSTVSTTDENNKYGIVRMLNLVATMDMF